MARTYNRDSRGRFASGGGGASRPAKRAAPTRAGNRLNRDNSGRITGIGRDGALARGGRLRTAGGAKRATQTARMAGVSRSGAMRGKVARDPGAMGRAGGRPKTQKEKWAARAQRRMEQAARAEARGDAGYSRHRRVGDNAFWTQPGLGRQRDKARAGIDRAMEDYRKAERLRERAANLQRMASTNKGDAERRRQATRDKLDAAGLKKGDPIHSVLYGSSTVVKVNRKTITIRTPNGGTFAEDKARLMLPADWAAHSSGKPRRR